jgi:hypothetical protein
MDSLRREAVVDRDTLVFEAVADPDSGAVLKIRLSGEVICFGGLRVRVLKWMDARGAGRELEVLTVYYQYQAWLPRRGARKEQSVLRYDQAHGGTPHRHQYDRHGDQVSHEELTLDTMPRLDTVIREAVAIVAAYEPEAADA